GGESAAPGFSLNVTAARAILARAPAEIDATQWARVALPTPEGELEVFLVRESPVMEDGLARRFPNLKTYVLRGESRPEHTGRLLLTDSQLHAFVMRDDYSFQVSPDEENRFFPARVELPGASGCETPQAGRPFADRRANPSDPGALRVFRAAFCATA